MEISIVTDGTAVKFEKALLELCAVKPLRKIAVSDLLQETGLSRQTFYRKFIDKQDLINRVYRDFIMTIWNGAGFEIDHYYGCIDAFHRMHMYKSFMKQAVLIEGQNNLKEYMEKYYIEWYTEAFKKAGMRITREMQKIIDFAATGYSRMYTNWALEDYNLSPEEMVKDLLLVQPPELKKMFKKQELNKMRFQVFKAE